MSAVISPVLTIEGASAAATTKSIELGQTIAEAEAALGPPEKRIKLGPKTIFIYKDLKITFLDGKVSDVQ